MDSGPAAVQLKVGYNLHAYEMKSGNRKVTEIRNGRHRRQVPKLISDGGAVSSVSAVDAIADK